MDCFHSASCEIQSKQSGRLFSNEVNTKTGWCTVSDVNWWWWRRQRWWWWWRRHVLAETANFTTLETQIYHLHAVGRIQCVCVRVCWVGWWVGGAAWKKTNTELHLNCMYIYLLHFYLLIYFLSFFIIHLYLFLFILLLCVCACVRARVSPYNLRVHQGSSETLCWHFPAQYKNLHTFNRAQCALSYSCSFIHVGGLLQPWCNP